MTGGLARGAAFSALALAVAPFILTAPAHAADDNTVSIAVDQNAALKPAGTLYKATTNVTVKTGKPYGFNLTMQADTADLVNAKDSTHKISATPSATPVALNANQWGYSLNKSATTFSAVPAAQATPVVIVDTAVKGKQAGCNCKDHCDTTVTFAANVDPAKLASGSYSTAITYTATAKPAPKPPVVEPTVCKSGDPQNDCQVDIDPNMIPVKYTGSTTNAQWTSLAKPEDNSNQGDWYNYNNKQWANAVTVKDPSKYKNQTRVVEQADILGFWVYIPRYAYEVMRRDVTDAPVPAQNFTIHFEKATDPKRYPAESNCAGRNMDYRTACGLNRDYIKGQPSDQGTWATHPAFTFGAKELNGIWFGKFETTGSIDHPTILPNQSHIGYEPIGTYYTVAKSLGVNDPQNIGGNSISTTQNSHNLAKFSSHMVNNSDWGAATYLSASKYGSGYNKVQMNTNGQGHSTGYNDMSSYGITGCGPRSSGDASSYGGNSSYQYRPNYTDEVGGVLGTQSACYSGDIQRAYNGTLGQLASTANNPTGIYDMSGGASEYTASSYTSDLNNSSTINFRQSPARPPYANIYNFDTLNRCTFSTCGGQALHEINSDSTVARWNGGWVEFVGHSAPWFERGGYYGDSHIGLFCTRTSNGGPIGMVAFRVALAPTAQN